MTNENKSWKVENTWMLNGNVPTTFRTFPSYKEAYSYFAKMVDDKNLTNADEYKENEELNAGGIGFDWRVELLKN